MSDKNPGDVSDTEAQKKLFMIYNVGQKKFLNMGGWWGTKPVLSEVPRLFWMQNHTENATTQDVTHYYTYPSKEGETVSVSPITVMQDYNGGKLQIGCHYSTNSGFWGFGVAPSEATYNSVVLEKKDGTKNNIFNNDDVSDGTIDRNVTVDFAAGDKIVANITLPQKTKDDKNENILSLGDIIGQMGAEEGKHNMHVFWSSSMWGNPNLRIAYVDGTYDNNTDAYNLSGSSLNLNKPVIFTFSKDGLNVQNDYHVTYDNPTAVLAGTTPDFLLKDNSKVQIGSLQGESRSNAVYHSIAVKSADGSVKSLYENFTVKDETDKDNKKFSKDVTVNFASGEKIVADLTLPATGDGAENIISIGENIAVWGTSPDNANNIHLYYKDGHVEVDNVTSTGFNQNTAFTIGSSNLHIFVEFSKNGVTIQNADGTEHGVNETYFVPCVVKYDADKVGQNVKLKKNTHYIYEVSESEGSSLVKNITQEEEYDENVSNKKTQTFIASNIEKSSGKDEKEGNFLSYVDASTNETDLINEADLGVFVDRALNPAKLSQATWNLSSVDGNMNDCKLSLVMPYDITNGKETSDKKDKTYYLAATSDYVKGYEVTADGKRVRPTDDSKFFYDSDPKGQGFTSDLSTATLVDETANAVSGYDDVWRIIPLSSYVAMLDKKPENIKELLDVTYLIKDPDFARENGDLNKWTTNISEDNLRIGYDNYYKTSTQASSYKADNELARSTHARYMDVAVTQDGNGEFYQDIKIYRRGWYVLQCQGKSNVGAKLFIERQGVAKSRVAVTLKNGLQNLDKGNQKWPYSNWMPMYNACVEMNDEHIAEPKIKEYANTVKYYISQDVSYSNPLTLRIGISIPENHSSDNFSTIFDTFRLQYGGKSDPILVLDEDKTDLNYIDNCIHDYQNKTLYLHRKFNKNHWSTIVLPVDLTHEQFIEMFGEGSKLAYLKEFKNNVVRYYTLKTPTDESATYLKAYMPYIIKVTTDGTAPGFTQNLTLREDHLIDESNILPQTVEDGNYVVAGVSLKHHQETNANYYDFAGGKLPSDLSAKVLSTKDGDEKWSYCVKATTEGDGVATNENDNKNVLTSYGTLCKTYTGKTIINTNDDKRPTLSDGKSYYFGTDKDQNTVMYLRKEGNDYGLQGFRSWFVYDGNTTIPGTQAAKVKFSIDGVEDETTEIGSIITDDNQTIAAKYANAIYNMNGQMVSRDVNSLSSLPTGLYIVNGKKYVVK